MVEGIYEYIEMNLVAATEKTETYAVRNRESQLVLGYVKWNCGWRQYCFYPEGETTYSKGCLMDICDFICKLMYERRNNERNG